MTLKDNICELLEECGFNLKGTPGYRVQIYTKENVVVVVEEKSNEKTCEGSCCENGKGYEEKE